MPFEKSYDGITPELDEWIEPTNRHMNHEIIFNTDGSKTKESTGASIFEARLSPSVAV